MTARRSLRRRCAVVGVLLLAVLPLAAGARDFLPIAEAERALVAVPGAPNAPAVVLFKKATLQFMDYPSDVYSSLEVNVRIKILTEEGKAYGEVELPHSSFYRLSGLEGRTVLPDGTVVPLPASAVFEERRSRSERIFVTKLVFPAVAIGAILDYHYTVRWDDLFFLEPFHFHDELPTLLSQIEFVKPDNLGLRTWAVQIGPNEIKSASSASSLGKIFRFWSENLAGVPDEPHSFPFADLSSRVMMIPNVIVVGGERQSLLEDWKFTSELYWDTYREARAKDRRAKRKAEELAGAAPSPLQRIAALFAFVRDEVTTNPGPSIAPLDGEEVDEVLDALAGSPAGKVLLLQSMLAALKIESDLLWIADRSEGRVDLAVANPWWFERPILRVVLDAQAIYLDPNDRGLGVGNLSPLHEGMQGVRVHPSKAEIVDLPTSAFDRHVRRAQVDLVADEEGRLTGEGTLELLGHRAWTVLSVLPPGDDGRKAWQASLEQDFAGFAVADLEIAANADDQRVTVRWKLVQREDEVLGDEASLLLSRPVGPLQQPFTLPPELRRGPVQLVHGARDEVVTTVRWAEGWQAAQSPRPRDHRGAAGTFQVEMEREDGERRLVYRRRLDRTSHEYFDSTSYGALRDLFGLASQSDAEILLLLRD